MQQQQQQHKEREVERGSSEDGPDKWASVSLAGQGFSWIHIASQNGASSSSSSRSGQGKRSSAATPVSWFSCSPEVCMPGVVVVVVVVVVKRGGGPVRTAG